MTGRADGRDGGTAVVRRFYEGVLRAEAWVAGTFLVVMVLLIFLGGVGAARGASAELDHRRRHLPVRLGVLPVRRHRVAARRPDVDRPRRRAPARRGAPGASATRTTLIIGAFLVYGIVGGLQLSWVSRARSFQGIPEISYSWVTMSLPVGLRCCCS